MSLDPANSELTAVAWILTLPGIEHGMCSTKLPKNQEEWAERGFIVVGPDAGGSQNPDVPWNESVMQLDVRAVNPNSLNPDWGKASTLAKRIENAAWANLSLNTPLTLRPGYHAARVTSAWTASKARRIPMDPSSYALYRLDLAINWIQIDLPEDEEES